MTLDLRTLADEWNDEIVALSDESPSYGELADAFSKFWELTDQLGIEQTPDALLSYANDCDPTLVADSEFKEYAQQLAEDIGAVEDFSRWPCDCIDWERAADELSADYTSITYDGDDYLMRG